MDPADMIHSSLVYLPPPPPTSDASGHHDAATVFTFPPGCSEDRISKLPEDVQRKIVSKLPVKDGAVTTALSSSWYEIWPSTPLVLDDAQLLPARADEDGHDEEAAKQSRAVVADKVLAILRSHPGPFQLVRITSSPASSLRVWLRIMAAKGVEELVVLNCEWPKMMTLSVEILRCRSLKRLHLALCHLPPLTLPDKLLPGRRVVDFPNLQQLVLYHAFVPASEIGHFLAGCPALELLVFIEGYGVPQYINTVVCPMLKCLLLWQYKPWELVVHAPRLERLIMWKRAQSFGPPKTRIIIKQAPNLRVVGYLHPKLHVLENGDMVSKEGTRATPAIMLPSVEILAVNIRFGLLEDERMLLSFLRVFPNITTLHIKSDPTSRHPDYEHDSGPGLWNNDVISSIACISKIKKFAFYEFHSMDNNSELRFIKSMAQTCGMLRQMLITTGCSSSVESPNWIKAQLLDTMSQVEWASDATTLGIIADNRKEWNYKTASDTSLSDPFDYIS